LDSFELVPLHPSPSSFYIRARNWGLSAVPCDEHERFGVSHPCRKALFLGRSLCASLPCLAVFLFEITLQSWLLLSSFFRLPFLSGPVWVSLQPADFFPVFIYSQVFVVRVRYPPKLSGDFVLPRPRHFQQAFMVWSQLVISPPLFLAVLTVPLSPQDQTETPFPPSDPPRSPPHGWTPSPNHLLLGPAPAGLDIVPLLPQSPSFPPPYGLAMFEVTFPLIFPMRVRC